jgi:hypothetical protein
MLGYVRLARLFSHYNDFNGAENSPSTAHYLIVKDQKSILSTSITFIHITNIHINQKSQEKIDKKENFR